jgi:hypothetical protein
MNGQTRIQTVREEPNGIIVTTPNNTYAFPWLVGDTVRGGTKADLEGVVTYGGDSVAKNYIKSHDTGEVPAEVLEAVGDRAVVVAGVTGGWANWEGRPEWSETYIDVSEVEVLAPEEATA